jgi:hypothetical protein
VTLARVCRRHSEVCIVDDQSDDVMCPRGHVVPERGIDVVRLEDGHIAIPGGNGVKTIMSRKFEDPEGATLFVRLTTAKRTPYVIRIQHVPAGKKSGKTGILATAGTESVGVSKLDEYCEDAVTKGWREKLGVGGREGLLEIPTAAKAGPKPLAAAK